MIGLVITHMEFLGYTVANNENGVYHLVHNSRFDIQIIEGDSIEMGLLFGGKLICTEHARKDYGNYMEYINDLNISSNVTKFFKEPTKAGDLVFQAWFPGNYDKTSFSMFMDFMQEDVTGQLSLHKDTDKFLEE